MKIPSSFTHTQDVPIVNLRVDGNAGNAGKQTVSGPHDFHSMRGGGGLEQNFRLGNLTLIQAIPVTVSCLIMWIMFFGLWK